MLMDGHWVDRYSAMDAEEFDRIVVSVGDFGGEESRMG